MMTPLILGPAAGRAGPQLHRRREEALLPRRPDLRGLPNTTNNDTDDTNNNDNANDVNNASNANDANDASNSNSNSNSNTNTNTNTNTNYNPGLPEQPLGEGVAAAFLHGPRQGRTIYQI